MTPLKSEPPVLSAIKDTVQRIERLRNEIVVEERSLGELCLAAVRGGHTADVIRAALGEATP